MRALLTGVLGLLAVGCATSRPAEFAAPMLFVGTLESETLIRRDLCPKSYTDTFICVSNACGIGEAVLHVENDLAGNPNVSRGLLRYALGEWCHPEFFGFSGPLLIAISDQEDEIHRFQLMPIYATAEGDVLLPYDVTRIGTLEVDAFYRPLREPIPFASVGTEDWHRDDLIAHGRVNVSGEKILAVQGIFLTDLIQKTSAGGWEALPRNLD